MPKKAESTALTLPVNADLTKLKADITRTVKRYEKALVTNTKTYEFVSEGIKEFAKLRKAITNLLHGEVAEKKALYDAYRKREKSLIDALTHEEDRLRESIEAYYTKQREAADAKIALAVASNDLDREASLVAKPFVPDVAGISFRTDWSFRLDDFRELVKAVAHGKVDIAALQANFTWLNEQAQALKEKLTIPGGEAVSTSSTVARTS